MKHIQVFDPALCCSTGVCGVDVDQTLVDFATDVEWARQSGVQIERFNLAQQPLTFSDNPTVKTLLERSGQAVLPLILIDGEVALTGRYPTREEIASWISDVQADSIFNDQVAELVAIGAAIAANCEPCFKFHYDKARKLKVTRADIQHAVDLAQKVKDTPAHAILDLATRYLNRSNNKASSISTRNETGSRESASNCCAPISPPIAPISNTGKCC